MHRTLTPAELARDLAIPDLTEGHHAIRALVDHAAAALRDRWGCAVRAHRGPRVVSVADNYDRLGFRAGDVTRDARYTRYVDDDHLLRSHTSALVPPALRAVAGAADVDDVLVVCPGVTYRRDAIDRLHTGTPHQLDLWRVRRGPGRALTPAHLDGMIDTLVKALLPGSRHRCEPRVHPYTQEGRQIDVLVDHEWVEIGECGLAHPDVLRGAGLDPAAGWTGLAMGLGLDRLLMVRKGVPDIRLLRSTDPRVAGQMLDLAPYRPVSHLPPVRRDLSVAVPDDDTAEDLGDRVRAALGDDADLLEAVEVVAATPGDQLPPAAIERLGLGPDQKNVLVRLVIRPYERTLTDAEANGLRDRVHAAIHQGTVPLTAVATP